MAAFSMLRAGCTGAMWGCAAGVALVILDRLASAPIPAWAPAAAAGAGAAIGAAWGFIARPSLAAVADFIDRRLNLDARLATAEAIDRAALPAGSDDVFARLARSDADSIAARVDPRQAAPFEPPRTALGALAAGALLTLGALFLPAIDWSRSNNADLTAPEIAQLNDARDAAAGAIEDTIAELQQTLPPDEEGTDAELAALDDLARQMRGEDVTADDFASARDESARRLSELAASREREARARDARAEELARRFETLEERRTAADEGESASSPADDLRDALARGDAEGVQEATRRITEAAGEMTDEERRAAAESLREAAERLRQAEAEAAREAAAREEALRESLREQGLSEREIDELVPPSADAASSDPRDPDQQPQQDRERSNEGDVERVSSPEDRLREEGVDPADARDLARRIEENQRRDEARRDADDTARDAAEALDELAEEVQRARPDSPPERSDPDEPRGEETGEQQRDRGESRPREGESNNEHSQQEQTRQDQTGEDKPGQNQPGRSQPGQDPSQQERQQQQQPGQEGDRQQQQQQRQPEQQPSQPGQSTEGTSREQAGELGEQNRGEQAHGQEGDESPEGDSPHANERRSLEEAVREWQRAREGGARDREAAEQAREAARRVAEQMTPQERQRAERWARELQREEGGGESPGNAAGRDDASNGGRGFGDGDPRDTPAAPGTPLDAADEPLDLRDPADPGQTIAQWLADERGEPDRAGEATEGGAAPPAVRRARRTAEQAVNEAAIPTRFHDIIRRYFERLPDTVREAAPTDPPGGD